MQLREQLEAGKTLDQLLPEAFALVRETARRVMGMRHFDVQMIGGLTLHSGKIAEMRTGEGKTLVATLAAYLNALPADGVHVITVNDYLARRDAQWMAPLYQALGMSIGVIQSYQGPDSPNSFRLNPEDDSGDCQPSGPVADVKPMPPISPTAPTMNLASTTCATTWPSVLEDKSQRGLTFAYR